MDLFLSSFRHVNVSEINGELAITNINALGVVVIAENMCPSLIVLVYCLYRHQCDLP